MKFSHCSTSSHFPVLRRYLKSDFFCAIYESQPSDISHRVTHTWLADAFKSSSHLPYISKEGHGLLHQQWMSSLTAHSPIPILRGYPKSSILCAFWVSTLADITLSDPWVALTCFWKLLPSTLFIKGSLWTISAAMNVSHCSTASHFQCWEGT